MNTRIKRGDIYYVNAKGPAACGSEQSANRPAIIVSNEKCNRYSQVVEVVYLTSQAKRPMPTHVRIDAKKISTALCEQVHSVSKQRLENCIGHITEQEERQMNEALKVSLMLEDKGEVMNELKVLNKTINSREVAEMVGKRHDHLVRDIAEYVTHISENPKLGFQDFFIESSYKTGGNNKSYKCYELTKQGCEMVANKLTGKKGVQFTALYVQRFNQMEQNQRPTLPNGKELLALAVLEAQRTIEQKDEQIKEMEPKAIFADSVSSSPDCILVRELAKYLKQNGIDIGQNRLFQRLREEGYLIKKKGDDWNTPTQRSMDMRLFEVKETTITRSDGHITVRPTTMVTGKGQQYFINKFLAG